MSLLSLGRSVALENESSLSYTTSVPGRHLCEMQTANIKKEFVSVNKELKQEHRLAEKRGSGGIRKSVYCMWSAQLLCK